MFLNQFFYSALSGKYLLSLNSDISETVIEQIFCLIHDLFHVLPDDRHYNAFDLLIDIQLTELSNYVFVQALLLAFVLLIRLIE